MSDRAQTDYRLSYLSYHFFLSLTVFEVTYNFACWESTTFMPWSISRQFCEITQLFTRSFSIFLVGLWSRVWRTEGIHWPELLVIFTVYINFQKHNSLLKEGKTCFKFSLKISENLIRCFHWSSRARTARVEATFLNLLICNSLLTWVHNM